MNFTNTILFPNHGNEPYLLGIRLAIRSGAKNICVPLYYGERQIQIIHEEFPDDLEKIYFSQQLGNLFSPLLRSVDRHWEYSDQVNKLFNKVGQKEPEIIQIEKQLRRLLTAGFNSKSIDKSREFHFCASNIDNVLNIGLPIQSFIKPTFFIFTALMSAVYSTPTNNDSETSLFSSLANYWRNLETEFFDIFIPEIHALSHLGFHFPNTTKCPPFARYELSKTDKLINDSILIITSGTQVYDDELKKVAKSFSPNFQILSYSIKSRQVDIISPDSISDNKIKAVLSRGGWGTIWKCLIFEKPIGYLNTKYSQDPEIAHTICTLNSLNIGFLIKSTESFSPPSIKQLDKYKTNIHNLMEHSKGNFIIDGKDYWQNGIDYVAEKIIST